MMSDATDALTKMMVKRNVVASPMPRTNHAVSENGMYMFRNTKAQRTANVTVPISWYFPRRYPGSVLLRNINLGFYSGFSKRKFMEFYTNPQKTSCEELLP